MEFCFRLLTCCHGALCVDKTVKAFILTLARFLADPEDAEKITDKTRKLGLVVVRGTQVSLVSPQDGVEEIANPFLVAEEDDVE